MVLSSTDSGDAKSITDVILSKLTKAGLTSSKIPSQIYNGTSVMVGHCGGVQCLFQERENRKVFCVHCLNHKLHLVVVHAMLVKQRISNFLNVCASLYNFFRKPTIELHYNGEKLKRLFEQRY